MSRSLILLLTIPLAACDPSALEGKSTQFQQHMERVALVTIPEPGIAPKPVVLTAAIEEITPPNPSLLSLLNTHRNGTVIPEYGH